MTRYHIDHRIHLLREPLPPNFDCRDVSHFGDYFFRDLLELYDWVDKNKKNGIPFFHFIPRFENKGPGVEVWKVA